MSDRYLKCKIFKGMFSDELAVEVWDRARRSSSYFVPKETVRGAIDQEGGVRVRVFERDKVVWAVLPNDEQTAIAVSETDLVAA